MTSDGNCFSFVEGYMQVAPACRKHLHENTIWLCPVSSSLSVTFIMMRRTERDSVKDSDSTLSLTVRGWKLPLNERFGTVGGRGRGQSPAQLSDGNRHLVLGIACRKVPENRSFLRQARF